MGKLSNMLVLLRYLQNGRKYTIKELAEKLEVTPRMVRVYKDELEKAGIYIDSIPGPYGGYILNEKLSSIDVGCTKQDINLLTILEDYLKDKKDFVFKKEYFELAEKVKSMYQNKGHKPTHVPYIGNLLNLKDTEDELKKFNKFSFAIKNKQKVRIKFISINSMVTERTIHPCDMYVYKNDWYVLAFCELKQEFRQFKLMNILEYEMLDQTFDENYLQEKI